MASEDRRRGSASTIEAEARDGGGRELGWLPVAELLEEAPFPDRDIGPALDSLASSVRLHGILSPLVVRRGPNGRLQVVCGWRRLLAARDAGEERVPVLMVDMGDAEAIRCWLSESSFRRDIDHETRERALRMLRDVHDRAIDSDERATEIGTPPSRFERTLEDRVTDEISVGPESFAIRGIPGDRLSSEREDGDTETLEARFESLVSRVSALFEHLLDTRRIDGDEASAIASDLLVWCEDAGRPPRRSEIYRSEGAGPDWLARHSLWVAALNAELAPRQAGSLDRRGYALGGILHDAGAVLLGPAYIEDPDAFEVSERCLVRAHPRVGHALIASLGHDWAEIALAARDHHERLDGSGYPEGRAGGLLGQLARATAVTSHYANLLGERPLHDAWSHDRAARALLRAASSGVLDRECVDRLLALPLDSKERATSARRSPVRVLPRRGEPRSSIAKSRANAEKTVS